MCEGRFGGGTLHRKTPPTSATSGFALVLLTPPQGGSEIQKRACNQIHSTGFFNIPSSGRAFPPLPLSRSTRHLPAIPVTGSFAQVGYAGEAARRLRLPGAEAILTSRPARRAENHGDRLRPPTEPRSHFPASAACAASGDCGMMEEPVASFEEKRIGEVLNLLETLEGCILGRGITKLCR